MRKLIIIICFVAGILTIGMVSYSSVIHSVNNSKVYANNTFKPPEGTREELYQDIFLSLLEPYTEKTIDDFYSKYLTDLPGSAPYFESVLSVQRIGNEPRTFDFLIKLEVAPYIGPHNSVGVDHITFRVRASGEVTLEKFEHIKSFEIAPNYQNIIKKWPPQ